MSTTRPTIKKSLARRIGRIAATLTRLGKHHSRTWHRGHRCPEWRGWQLWLPTVLRLGADQWVLRGTFPVGNYGLGSRRRCGLHELWGTRRSRVVRREGHDDRRLVRRVGLRRPDWKPTGVDYRHSGVKLRAQVRRDASDWGEPGAPACAGVHVHG